MFSEWGVRAGVLGRGHEGSGSLGGGGVNREKILATRAPRLEVKMFLVFFVWFLMFFRLRPHTRHPGFHWGDVVGARASGE